MNYAEANFDVLPRLNEIKYASGILDELLYLSVPSERTQVSLWSYGVRIRESSPGECVRTHQRCS